MPADFVIDVGLEVVFSKGAGVLRHEDLLDHQARLAVHPDFRPHFNQLIDMREVLEADVTGEQLAALAAPLVFDRSSRRAIVVSSDLQYGLSRMYEAFSELRGDTGLAVFRDAQAALDFLGIDRVPPADAFTHLLAGS